MSVSALHQLMRYEMPPALSHFNETTYMTRRRYYESYHQNHPSKILPKSQIWYPLYPRQDGIPLSQFHGIHESTASLSPTRNTQYTQRVYPIFQNTRGLPSSYQQPQNEVLELQNQTELAAKQSRQSIDPKLLAIPPADRTMKSPSSELPLLSFQRTTDPANIFQEQSRYDWNELQFHLPPVVPDVPADVFCRDILKEKEKSHQDMLLNYVSNLESPQHSESEKDVNNNCCDPLPLFKESSEIQDKYNDSNNAVISHLSHFRPPQSEHTNRGIDHNFCSTACHSEASQIRDPYKDASHTVFNTLSLFRSPQTVDTNRSVDHSFCNIGSPPFRDMCKDANNAVFSHRSHFRLPQTEGTNIGIDQSFCTTASHSEASQMRDIHMDAIRLFCDERLDFDSPQIEDTNKDANDNICNRFSKFESLPIQDSCKDVNSKVCVKKETLSPCDSSIVADKEVFDLTRVKVEKIEDKHFTDNCNQYGNFDSTSRLFLDETSQQRSQMSMMKNTGPLATESMTTNIKLEPEDEVHLKSETDVCLIVGAATVTNNIFDKFVSELNKT